MIVCILDPVHNIEKVFIRLIHKMRGHDEDCFSVSWCPTQGSDWQMVSSSRDKTLRVWSFTEGKSVQKIKLPSSGKGRGNASSSFVCCVWLDEHRILASGENGELVLANLDTVGRKEKEGIKVDLLHKEHFKAGGNIFINFFREKI